MSGRLALGAVVFITALGGSHAHGQTKESRPSEGDIFGAPAKEQEKPKEQPTKEQPAKEPEATPPRPNEGDIFGAPAKEQEAPAEPGEKPAKNAEKPGEAPPVGIPGEPALPPGAEGARDQDLLGNPEGATRLSEETAPEDPLKIGGMFYLRSVSTGRQGQSPDDWTFSAPALLDVYLDVRPNDRVRGLVLERMIYDASAPVTAPVGPTTSDTAGSADLTSLFGARTRGPTTVLDQMWLRFDLDRTLFITAGKQHVRWGTGRFWAPTDYLHVRKRNPLDVFDARTGTSMLKLHLPWEETGWNFYAYALMEGPEATPTIGNLAGAARAEIVLGDAELGAGALVKRGEKPKIGLDLSKGIWDFDAYAEVALRWGSEIDRVVYDETASPELQVGERPVDVVERVFPRTRRNGVKTQVVGGMTWEHKYNDNDTFTVGAEYFYNPLGYDSPEVYPGLILPRATPLQNPATFFYLGRHYGSVFVLLPAPYSWNYTTFTLSTLGNLSDQSFTTRLDYSLTLLTHLRFEAYVGVRYGRREGEFRFGVEGFKVGNQEFNIKPGLIDLGLALRVNM
jgi:hypothetical protein